MKKPFISPEMSVLNFEDQIYADDIFRGGVGGSLEELPERWIYEDEEY